MGKVLRIVLVIFLLSLFLTSASGVAWKLIKWATKIGITETVVAAGVSAGAYLGIAETTINQVIIDIGADVKNTTVDKAGQQRFVLDPDEPPESPERNIFVDNVKPLKGLGLNTRLFWIRANGRTDDVPIVGAFSPVSFTIGGPIIQKSIRSGEIPEKELVIAHGGTGTAIFPGLMQVKINNPDYEPSAVGIEGFIVSFEKDALNALIQGVSSPEKDAKDTAARLAGKKVPTEEGESSDEEAEEEEGEAPEQAPPTKDKWFKIE